MSLTLTRLTVLLVLSLCTAKIPIDQFFPFGEEVGDTTVPRGDDTGTPPINLTIAFPYFDYLHDVLWVSVNGAISFLQVIQTYTPSCEPVARNFRMIGPFWADVDIRETGVIWYRDTTDSSVLNRMNTEITQAFPGAHNVRMRWAFVVTWFNVTYFKDDCPSCDRKRNSFQTILATDGIQSYALFLYENVTWTTGDASGGTLGLGGTPAQAGFDAGDAINRFMIPGSCTAGILTVNERSNVGVPGKWLFRVDNSDIQPAGCTTNFDGKLRFSPSFISSLKDSLQISGPCVSQDANVTCIFNDPGRNSTEVPGVVYGNDTSARIVCETPFLYSVGQLNVGLRIETSNSTSTFTGTVFVVDPADLDDDLEILEQNETDSSEFQVQWNPALFGGNVTLVLEALFIANTPQAEWQIFQLASSIPNNGIYLVDNETAIALLEAFNFNASNLDSFIRIALVLRPMIETREDALEIPPVVLRLLLNFAKLALNIVRGQLLSGAVKTLLCEAWLAAQVHSPYPPPPADLVHCPPTQLQVDNDPRFEATNVANNLLHGLFSSEKCYQTRTPTTTGYGQECCYKHGTLVVGPPGGGNIQRWSPHQKSGWTHHIIEDMLPRWLCCSFNIVNLALLNLPCKQFYDQMGYDDGSQYQPWVPATAHGDPHITTFDNFGYTFNGAGEFWMLKNTSEQPVLLQARMEKFNDASIFTAFAMKSTDSPVIQLQKSDIRIVDVYIGDVTLDLSQLRSVNLGSVMLNVAEDRSQVAVAFPSGIAFIISTSSAFGLMTSADDSNKGKTIGLLGTFDGNSTNDLMTPDGTIIPSNSSLHDIHYQFGLKWMLTAEESIFNYFNKTFADYNFPDYEPNFNFSPEDASPEAVELCGDDWNCLYDYTTTGDETIANQTLALGDQYNETRTITEQNITNCAGLGILDNGNCYYANDSLLPPAAANCTCASGYELIGDSIFVCQEPDLKWNGSIPTCRALTTTPATTTSTTTTVITPSSTLKTDLPLVSTSSQSSISTTSVRAPSSKSPGRTSTDSSSSSSTIQSQGQHSTTTPTTTTVTKTATMSFHVISWLPIMKWLTSVM